MRERQDSIHTQLTDAPLRDSVKSKADREDALRSAAKGGRVLMVLDDMWDPRYERELNCLDLDGDQDNGSRLFITTRIRKLIKGSIEVDVGGESSVALST